MRNTSFASSVWLIVFIALCSSAAPSTGQDIQESDGITLQPSSPEDGPKNWALLIGINYTHRQHELQGDARTEKLLPELKNAVNDAKAFADVLKKFYVGYSDETVTVLTDDASDPKKQPTADNIRQEINRLSASAHQDDSVLIFFAGHGYRDANLAAIFAQDVLFKEGRPIGTNYIDVPDDLISLVEKIESKHRLVVLDCCYSGEIFNGRGKVHFQEGRTASAGDKSLQSERSFQAMASCRAPQEASDGAGLNSLFTTALLDGLRHLPARTDGDSRVWANRLLAYIALQAGFNEAQRPDCRNLNGFTGEFCFYPKSDEKLFQAYALPPAIKDQLKAMFVSRQGNWWFDEMPWFMPSIRSEIVQEHERLGIATRATSFSDLVELGELKKATKTVLENQPARNRLQQLSPVAAKRYEHANALLNAADSQKRNDVLTEIETQFLTWEKESSEKSKAHAHLTAEDLHFLALVQHALKREGVKGRYEAALAAYQERINEHSSESADATQILAALCRADFGQFLRRELEDNAAAAKEFALAREAISSFLKPQTEQSPGKRTEDAAVFFDIFMKCQEADAWVAINRFSPANDLYENALNSCVALAPNHYLHAHVFRQKAWSEIIQWRIAESMNSFEQSNKILQQHFDHQYAQKMKPAPSPDPADQQPTLAPAVNRSLPPSIRESEDYALVIAYLHNMHGIAMAKRFSGDTRGALEHYRWLSREVESAFSRFRRSTANSDLERQFVVRVVNTLERLGDSNLFGDPEVRDIREAFDDYRRAISRAHVLRELERDQLFGCLLYKQAIALSVPSPIQNTKLALEMCKRADQLYSKHSKIATGLWQSLGELTTHYVRHMDHVVEASADSGSLTLGQSDPEKLSPAAALRQAIIEYRDRIGTSPHRDQLELCLFCSQALLEHDEDRDTYQHMVDADLLNSFCTQILSQDNEVQGEGSSIHESSLYLRPYFDSIMRSKLSLPSPNVKELLEIQAEATLGSRYVKPLSSAPVVATYVLDNDCYLLVDIPRRDSYCVKVTDQFDMDTLGLASASEKLLPLPRRIQRALSEAQATTSLALIEVRSDKLPEHQPALSAKHTKTVADGSRKSGHQAPSFPFELPALRRGEAISSVDAPIVNSVVEPQAEVNNISDVRSAPATK